MSKSPIYHASWDILDFERSKRQTQKDLGKTKLPAEDHMMEARNVLQNHQLCIGGGTGSGKTILACFVALTSDPSPRVIVAQQRRAPQVLNAAFMGNILPLKWMGKLPYDKDDIQLDPKLKVTVKVRVAGNLVKYGNKAKIEDNEMVYTTTGLYCVLSGGHDFSPTAVVIDEIHERTAATDYAMHTLIQNNIGRINLGLAPCRLILASATGWEDVMTFLNNEYDLQSIHNGRLMFKGVDIKTPIYPIEDKWFHKDVEADEICNAVVDCLSSPTYVPTYTKDCITIIFIPGHKEGETIKKLITKEIGTRPEVETDKTRSFKADVFNRETREYCGFSPSIGRGTPCDVFFLDGSTDHTEMEEALRPDPDAHKIVLSTDFLESSGTVVNGETVIVCGYHNVGRYDVDAGCEIRMPERIPTRSEMQQRGRVGRTRAATCIRLWRQTSKFHNAPAMCNPDEDLAAVMMRFALRNALQLPKFLPVTQAELPKESGYEAIRYCRIDAGKGVRLLTIYDKQTVVGIILELKLMRLVDASGRLTVNGKKVADWGLANRYGAMLAHEKIDEGMIRYTTDLTKDQALAAQRQFVLAAIAVVVDTGRNPLLSQRAVDKTHIRRLGHLNEDNADTLNDDWSMPAYSQYDNSANDKFDQFGNAQDKGKNPEGSWKMREMARKCPNKKLYGPPLPDSMGEHLERFFIVHAFIHTFLKHEFVSTRSDKYMYYVNQGYSPQQIAKMNVRYEEWPDGQKVVYNSDTFLEHFRTYRNRRFETWCTKLAIHPKAMTEVVDNMQRLQRRGVVDWMTMPNFYWDYGNARSLSNDDQRLELKADITWTLATFSTLNFGRIDRTTSRKWPTVHAVKEFLVEINDRASGMKIYDDIRDNQVDYIVWDEAGMEYDQAKQSKKLILHTASPIYTTTQEQRDKLNWMYNEKVSFAEALADAREHVEQGYDINMMPPTSYDLDPVPDETMDFDPRADTSLGSYAIRAPVMVTFTSKTMSPAVQSIINLRSNEWRYLLEDFPKPTEPSQIHFKACREQLIQRRTIMGVVQKDIIDEQVKDRDFVMFANPTNATWWFGCRRCHAFCRVTAGRPPPAHLCDEEFKMNRLDAAPARLTLDLQRDPKAKLIPYGLDPTLTGNLDDIIAAEQKEHDDPTAPERASAPTPGPLPMSEPATPSRASEEQAVPPPQPTCGCRCQQEYEANGPSDQVMEPGWYPPTHEFSQCVCTKCGQEGRCQRYTRPTTATKRTGLACDHCNTKCHANVTPLQEAVTVTDLKVVIQEDVPEWHADDTRGIPSLRKHGQIQRAAAVVIDQDQKLVMLTKTSKGRIGFPGGKIFETDPRTKNVEAVKDASRRELHEETGVPPQYPLSWVCEVRFGQTIYNVYMAPRFEWMYRQLNLFEYRSPPDKIGIKEILFLNEGALIRLCRERTTSVYTDVATVIAHINHHHHTLLALPDIPPAVSFRRQMFTVGSSPFIKVQCWVRLHDRSLWEAQNSSLTKNSKFLTTLLTTKEGLHNLSAQVMRCVVEFVNNEAKNRDNPEGHSTIYNIEDWSQEQIDYACRSFNYREKGVWYALNYAFHLNCTRRQLKDVLLDCGDQALRKSWGTLIDRVHRHHIVNVVEQALRSRASREQGGISREDADDIYSEALDRYDNGEQRLYDFLSILEIERVREVFQYNHGWSTGQDAADPRVVEQESIVSERTITSGPGRGGQ